MALAHCQSHNHSLSAVSHIIVKSIWYIISTNPLNRLNDFLRLLPGYLLLLVAVLYVFTMASAFITAYTDPGILPRGVNPKSEIAMNGSTDYGGDPVSLLVYHPNCPDVLLGKEIVSGDNKIFVKYCYTCEIFRPPRASHCSYCDNCVEEFDHHCPWVSNCVGRRNYRYFLLFLFQLALLIDYAMSIMIAMLYKANQLKGESVGDTLVEYPGIIAIIALCALTGLGVHWLVIYNILLIARDQTTSESIKGYESTTNRTCGENCCRIFFSGRPNRHVAWQTYEPHPVSSLFWKSRP